MRPFEQIGDFRMSRWIIAISLASISLVNVLLGSLAGADEWNAAINSISIPDIRAHIEVLADDSLEGREAGSRGGRAAAAYLAEQLAEFGLRPGGDRDTFAQSFQSGSYRNVLAVIEGSDPVLKQEYVLVGAHYDHVGYGTPRNSRGPRGYVHNGADDNASGVSGSLEAAQAAMLLDQTPKRSILFAFWDGEEKGMLGSKHWVSHPTVPLQDVTMAFNADMIGRLRGETLHVFGTRTAPGLRRWLSENNQLTDLLLDISWEMKPKSDHYPLVEGGIPTLMLHTGLHDQWHRPSDDVDKINHEGISAAARLLFSMVVDAANRPSRFPFRSDSRFESPSDQVQLEKPVAPRSPRLGIAWRREEGVQPGVTIANVTPGSAADRAGLQVGDRLVEFAGREASDEGQLGVAIWAANSPTTAVVEREDGQTLQISVELDGRPLRFGISWREDEGEPGTVLLTEVVPHSAAHLAGLKIGDRIYRVAGRDFRDGNELAKLLSSLPSPVPMQIERSGQLRSMSIDAPSAD
jgi:hypothetical protein